MKSDLKLPYTIVGHTVLTPEFCLHLTGCGIKAIAEQVKDDDIVTIKISETQDYVTVSHAPDRRNE